MPTPNDQDPSLLAAVRVTGAPPLPDGLRPLWVEFRDVPWQGRHMLAARVEGHRGTEAGFFTYDDDGRRDLSLWPDWLAQLWRGIAAGGMGGASEARFSGYLDDDAADDDPAAQLARQWGAPAASGRRRSTWDRIGLIVTGLVLFGLPCWVTYMVVGDPSWALLGGLVGGFILSRIIVTVSRRIPATRGGGIR
jgi:hypothetical protein